LAERGGEIQGGTAARSELFFAAILNTVHRMYMRPHTKS
jgi:hypothetical protein